MADTNRTQLDLLENVFQNAQAAGSITAQDVRDLILSSYNTGRQIVIQEKADFPAPVSGVISLAAATDYLVVNAISLGTDVISITDGSSLSGTSSAVTLTTNSATALITTTNGLEADNIGFVNTGGPCLALGVAAGKSVLLNRVGLISLTDSTITSTGADAGLVMSDTVFIGAGFGAGGLVVTGDYVQALFRGCIWGNRPGTGTALTLDAAFTCDIFNVSETQFNMSTGQTALSFDAGITPTTSGGVNNCVFSLAGTAVGLEAGGITSSSTNWSFTNNNGIVNTPVHGWEYAVDSEYNDLSGDTNKLAIADGVRTQITIDGLGTGNNQEFIPNSGTVWNTTTNKFTPSISGACYDLRLLFKSSYDAGADAHVDVEIDIGGALGVIYKEQRIYVKGAGITNDMAWSVPIFTLDTFIANGGTFYITPNDSPIKVWDIKLLIVETFDPVQGV